MMYAKIKLDDAVYVIVDRYGKTVGHAYDIDSALKFCKDNGYNTVNVDEVY